MVKQLFVPLSLVAMLGLSTAPASANGPVGTPMSATSPEAQKRNASGLTDAELAALIDRANSPADHGRLAEYYEAQASELERKSVDQRERAERYRHLPDTPRMSRPVSLVWQAVAAANRLSRESKEARNLAQYHRILAKG